MIKIGKAAQLLGVSTATLRRWDKEGALVPVKRGPGGTRYYDLGELQPSEFKLYEVPTKALLFELLRREAVTDQSGTG